MLNRSILGLKYRSRVNTDSETFSNSARLLMNRKHCQLLHIELIFYYFCGMIFESFNLNPASHVLDILALPYEASLHYSMHHWPKSTTDEDNERFVVVVDLKSMFSRAEEPGFQAQWCHILVNQASLHTPISSAIMKGDCGSLNPVGGI